MRRLKIFFHDNCFDGAASAALFAAFYRATVDTDADVVLQGVQHTLGDPFDGHSFDGDDNACLDFRYTARPGLTWWFDHHLSAFQPPELRAHFEADTTGHKFYDPQARSNTKFQATVLREQFDFAPDGVFEELVHWADIIDGAQFADARAVVQLGEPALRIMTWLAHNEEPELTHRLIRALGDVPLAELAQRPWVREPLAPLLEANHRHVDLIGERAAVGGGVAFFDLTRDGVGSYNKFIPYMLFPEARYAVSVTASADRAAVSVGFNPWGDRAREHNIARLCEAYGGGGHAVVGGVSLPPTDVERARTIAAAIAAALRD